MGKKEFYHWNMSNKYAWVDYSNEDSKVEIYYVWCD